MRGLKLGLVVCTVQLLCVASSAAQAGECTRLGAVGDGLTKGIAEIMSTNGLKNVIESKGMKGQGLVTTTCKDGTFLTQCHSSQMACK